MKELEGKVAIVTGSGRGVGRGIAMRYAAEGVKVTVASRTKSSVEEVVDEIRIAGGTAIGITCDVGYRDQLEGAIARTAETFGRIDILVNNAQGFGTEAEPAGTPVLTPLEEFRDAEWEYTLRTGASATYWAMKAVFPHLKERGGRIINLGSQWGVVGWEGAAAYNATKEAIRALTRTAAREWGKYKITVNCINPVVMSHGVISTIKYMPDLIETMAAQIPVRRWGDPYKDAGGLAVFLASEDASYLTGMTFPLDGGINASA